MKNHINLNVIVMLFLSLISIAGIVSCQQAKQITGDDFPTELPKTLKLDNSRPQTYNVSLHWINRDIDGTLINENTATAKYTRGFEDSSVIWNEVKLNGTKLPELDGLTYKIDYDNFTKQEFYNSFPQEHIDLIRWFIQDAVSIEIYGWMYFDSLKLNQVFQPDYFKHKRIDIENYVNFTSQGLSLCWTGVSKINNEKCVIIHYQSMYNPVDANTTSMKLQGRSLYWGDIWVSLTDKHIEYATMNEDVVFKMFLTTNKIEQRLDLQREIVFEKINL